MSLQNKLNRFKKQLTNVGSEETIQRRSQTAQIDHKPDSKWASFQAQPLEFENQHCILREKHFGPEHQFGHYRLKDLQDIVKRWNERELVHPLSAMGRDSADLLFFDTETTGLGSGAGNTIFLLGLARMVGEEIQVRQYFLPGPGHEVAFYHHFLTDVKDMTNLVTYNGKAFDWPQVRTRHTFVRDMVPKLPPFGHFDLLHGARRIWKKSYESLRLSIVENELLNIERTEDTPGYLAPMLYFEYLREQDPDLLKGVFEHNELDVLSLISLYTHMSTILLDISHSSLTTVERYEVARWFEAVGNIVEAKNRYVKLLDTTASLQAKKSLADLHKKERNYEKAVHYWKSILHDNRDVETYVELSKVYEHKYKDYEQAFHYAKLGYQSWKETKRILKNKVEKERTQFKKRIERLEKKRG